MFSITLPGGGLFGGAPSPPAQVLPPPPPPLPTPEDPEIARKAERDRIAAQRRKGLLTTNLTAGQQLGDQAASTQRNVLLGN